jgi:hypothetical protein
LASFREESKARLQVLRRLGHVAADGTVLLKGRAACEIDTADELLTVGEQMNLQMTSLWMPLIDVVVSSAMQMQSVCDFAAAGGLVQTSAGVTSLFGDRNSQQQLSSEQSPTSSPLGGCRACQAQWLG